LNTPEHRPICVEDILSRARTLETLQQLGHSPRHPLGQNFLIDPNIVRKSTELAQIAQGERVVEIGPGLGTLTAGLLLGGAQVWAVEFDQRLFEHLKNTLAPRANGKLHLLNADAVKHPLAGIPLDGQPFKIVANLPYAIATPWMDGVLKQAQLPERMVLMLQRETAERFCAKAGKARGAISIYIEAAFEAEPGHAVSRKSFHPPPDVESVLLNLKKREDAVLFPESTKALIRHIFTQRRKQIGAIIRKMPQAQMLADWLQSAQIDPRARPETLTLAHWLALDKILRD